MSKALLSKTLSAKESEFFREGISLDPHDISDQLPLIQTDNQLVLSYQVGGDGIVDRFFFLKKKKK